MPNKKIHYGLDLQQNKITGLPAPFSASDAVSKSYVDGLTDTFVKTFTEPFANDDYIASSTNMILENGYIRANRQYQVSVDNFSASTASNTNNIAYENGKIKLSTSTAGSFGTYTSNAHIGLTSSDNIYFASNITHQNADTYGSETEITTSNLQSDVVHYKQVIDTSNRVWHFYQIRSSANVYGWVTDANGNSVIGHTLLSTGVAAIAVSPAVQAYRTLQATTNSNGHIYLTFWTGGSSTLGRIRTLKLTINSGALNYGTTSNTWTSSTTFFDDYNPNHGTISCVDTFYDTTLNRLHIVYQTGTSTYGAQHRIIAGGSFSQVSQNLIWSDSGAKQLSIAYNDTAGAREIGIFFFDLATSSAVRGLRYTLDVPSYPNGTTGGVVFANSCFGMGSAQYDSANNRYILFIVNQLTSGDNTFFSVASITKSFTLANQFTVLSGPLSSGVGFGTTTYKDTSSFLENGVFSVLAPNNDSVNRNYLLIKFSASSGSFSSSETLIAGSLPDLYPVFVKQGTTLRVVWSRLNSAGTGATPFSLTFEQNSTKVMIEVKNSLSNWVTVYNNNPSWNNGTLVNNLSDESLNTPNVISLGVSDTSIQVRYTLGTPNGAALSPLINNYKIFVNNNVTSSATGIFTSETLIDDRLISKATLSADVTQINGDVTWRMSNNGGSTWENVTPGVETIFDSPSNNLKVEGTITLPSGIANANSTRINSYNVQTTNVVLQSDLYAMQVNMLKLGLQVTALSTANRLNYKNMMIDLFSSGDGVTLSGTTLLAGTITGTGTVTSVVETADITEVSSIILCAEGSGTITYDVSRDDGVTWQENVALDTVIPLTLGTVTNKIKIRANMDSANLLGWAYLYA